MFAVSASATNVSFRVSSTTILYSGLLVVADSPGIGAASTMRATRASAASHATRGVARVREPSRVPLSAGGQPFAHACSTSRHVAALAAEIALPINQQIGGPPLTEFRVFSDFVVLRYVGRGGAICLVNADPAPGSTVSVGRMVAVFAEVRSPARPASRREPPGGTTGE